MLYQVQQALEDSITRVMTGIANLLPGLVALLMAVAISSLIAWAAGLGMQRFLRYIDFDGRFSQSAFGGMADLSPENSPALLLSRLLSLAIVFLGLSIGVAAFDTTLTSRLVGEFLDYLPRLVTALVLLAVGNVSARYFARSVLIGGVNMNLQYPRLVSTGVKWLILVFTAAMALNHLGIGGQIVGVAFAILFGGITLTLSLAVGLGAKNYVSRTLEQRSKSQPDPVVEQFHHS